MPFLVIFAIVYMMKLLTAEPILKKEKPTTPPTRRAKLVIFLIGDNPASLTYVTLKQQEGGHYGIETEICRFDATTSDVEIGRTIQAYAEDPAFHGMMMQLPLPEGHDRDSLLSHFSPKKDVDALLDTSAFTSPMTLAIQSLMREYKLSLSNKQIAVLGRGHVVGRPIMHWLDKEGVQYTQVNRGTENKDELIQAADIVFAGTGYRGMVHAGNTRPNQIIFDCSGYDVDFDAVKDNVAAITPPKGAIGPLVVHYLLMNTGQAAKLSY